MNIFKPLVAESPWRAASQSASIRTRAFSLIEVLLAIIILGIGVIGIAALFPAGIVQQQRSADDIMGPIVAKNALAVLRSKLSQDDFGAFQDFDINPADGFPDIPPEFSQMFGAGGQPWFISGDWLWRRPAVMFADDPNTSTRDERGAIDIFYGDDSLGNVLNASDGIPFNPQKWFDSATGNPLAPAVVFTRAERMYPQGDKVRNVGVDQSAQYYWDCMFRRFEGRILVAIFVYRVATPPGEDYIYSTPQNPDVPDVPMMPYQRSFVDVVNDSPPWTDALDTAEFWLGPNSTAVDDYEPYEIPQTDPDSGHAEAVSREDVRNLYDYNWQATSQWLLDQNNNVYRVLAGRERNDDEPVKLVQPIPLLSGPNGFSGVSAYFYDRAPANDFVGRENTVTNLWYVPTTIQVDLDGDGNTDTPVKFTPVYVTVEEL